MSFKIVSKVRPLETVVGIINAIVIVDSEVESRIPFFSCVAMSSLVVVVRSLERSDDFVHQPLHRVLVVRQDAGIVHLLGDLRELRLE